MPENDESTGEEERRFLEMFDRVRIEFPGEEYPAIEWVKAKSDVGSTFDCIEICRTYTKELKRKQNPFPIKIQLFVENNPKKYRLSP